MTDTGVDTKAQPDQYAPNGVTASLVNALGHVEAAVKPRLRGVLHQGGFFISLVTGTVLIQQAGRGLPTVACSIYAVTVCLLFGTSAAYHRYRWSERAFGVMARLDHSMIFVLIAGTYTPFCLLLVRGWVGWTIFGIAWGGAVAGIALRNCFASPPRWIFVALYLVLGWMAVVILPQIIEHGTVPILVLLIVGGAFYSLGAVVYGRRKPDPSPTWFGFHEIFHAFTLAAFVSHYVAISMVASRA